MNQKPARPDIIVLKQLLNFIPRSVLNHDQTARKTGVDTKACTFSVLSHLASMLFAQLSHAIGLNDVCDWLRLKAAALSRLQIVPPSCNTLSHANKVRLADFIETLFWSVLAHLQHIQPGFASCKKGKGLLRRFKVRIHAVDSSVMELVANCIGWAKHRRRKAAAKMYLRLDLHSFLPSFAVVDTAAHHDNRRSREVCAGIVPGEIVVFDKAYVDFRAPQALVFDASRTFWALPVDSKCTTVLNTGNFGWQTESQAYPPAFPGELPGGFAPRAPEALAQRAYAGLEVRRIQSGPPCRSHR